MWLSFMGNELVWREVFVFLSDISRGMYCDTHNELICGEVNTTVSSLSNGEYIWSLIHRKLKVQNISTYNF